MVILAVRTALPAVNSAFLTAFRPFSSRSQTTTELRTRAQTMPQGNNSPTTQRLSEKSERHGSTNGALSFSQTFLSETTEYNLLNGNYEQDLRAVSIIHSSGINVLFFMLESWITSLHNLFLINLFSVFLFLVESEMRIMRIVVVVPRPLSPLKPTKKKKALSENDQGRDFR